ncbi:hypothetical protein EVAR_58855_1 [Eumeta japonica]|uniref:Uncharacterized protein n=1 Tax=Eumeta variegata TaxID=151549 RepID=A0A4C1Y781_EUMVA|nr:hypothetical protein EVAR_58855_1 [Eumeta japonica]
MHGEEFLFERMRSFSISRYRPSNQRESIKVERNKIICPTPRRYLSRGYDTAGPILRRRLHKNNRQIPIYACTERSRGSKRRAPTPLADVGGTLYPVYTAPLKTSHYSLEYEGRVGVWRSITRLRRRERRGLGAGRPGMPKVANFTRTAIVLLVYYAYPEIISDMKI